MNQPPNIAITGVTGAVGQEFLRILDERNFPFADVKMLASSRSAGKPIDFAGRTYTVEELTADAFAGVDLVLSSTSGSLSRQFTPIAIDAGAVVVDNTSAFRMDPSTPLVVPEVNSDDIAQHRGVIANPNCSTIIMNVPIWPLHQAVPIRRIVISTYQAASGAGARHMAELEQQARDWVADRPLTRDIWQRQYIFNLFSHDSDVDADTGYNTEETKMIHETRKIFHDPDIKVSVTCIRVPVLRAHCESLNLTFAEPVTEQQVRDILTDAPGVRIVDDRRANHFPEPLDASGQDDVLVGRIRQDLGQDGGVGIEMFIAGDQLRKGAALNAIQIAEHLLPSL